ncbi:MAG: hypothetical protein ACRC54_02445 [Fusobacteriaceae bacterium]
MKKFLMTTLFLSVSLLAMSATKNYDHEQAKKDLTAKGYQVSKETNEEYKIVKGKTQIDLKEYKNENEATVAFSEALKQSYAAKDKIVPEKSNIRKGIFVFEDSKVKGHYILHANAMGKPVVANAQGSEKDLREVFSILKENRKTVQDVQIDTFEMKEPQGSQH